MSINSSDYPWNVRLDMGGVTFMGPGMESRQEAQAIKNIVESSDDGSIQNIEVERQ